ncbi:MAG: bifunctional hydroxymethylpyrimidine kinase/phosphomethylpyrimidine kinase [bacterium]|jgi:hydroxymethylpyrimidine kinase/phosphomethylpyrimidine kinase|nr:bifunctional hydroxymethylpyrimidine kinase/phosphomethylpyrimidine kinase [Bacillota bacterium]HHW55255.1 bifunctional hydroxymethylpyrimidine kinase/phosphomethylpyrimidine kinase [Bacillota bacterium]
MLPKALTIAGSDSGGGAGIQADLKTFAALGVYGASVITAVTAQNTLGVTGVHNLPPEFVAQQLEAVLSDIGADAAKIGMLANADIIGAVADKVQEHGLKKLVLDPVMVAKSGDHLLAPEAREALKERLLPLALVVTPNIHEAEVLTGMGISDLADMEKAARVLHSYGTPYVIVKGGHLEGVATDVLFDGSEFHHFTGERFVTKNTHGTGCTYSAAIAAGLARGLPVFEAVQQAKEYINTALAFALDIGGGHGPTHHLASLYRDRERYRLLQEMQAGVALLEGKAGLAALIPEVQSNLLAALPYARGPEDIAALPGRLVKWGERVRAVGLPTFGASRHMVAVLIPALEADPEVRAVMNIRYSPEIIAACEQAGLTVASFDRQEKPEDYAARPQNRYREWGTAAVIEEKGFVPDVIYDRGGWCREAQVRVFGKGPRQVAEKVLAIFRKLEES